MKITLMENLMGVTNIHVWNSQSLVTTTRTYLRISLSLTKHRKSMKVKLSFGKDKEKDF